MKPQCFTATSIRTIPNPPTSACLRAAPLPRHARNSHHIPKQWKPSGVTTCKLTRVLVLFGDGMEEMPNHAVSREEEVLRGRPTIYPATFASRSRLYAVFTCTSYAYLSKPWLRIMWLRNCSGSANVTISSLPLACMRFSSHSSLN